MTEEQTFRSGFISIVGRPNSGKSTLVNHLVGEKVSIVTNKPQTTRNVIRGILTLPEGQLVFLDTPGVHKPMHRMNERMMEAVRAAMNEVDILALTVDASIPFGRGDEFTLDLIKPLTAPKFLLLNKIDRIAKADLLPIIDRYSKLVDFQEIVPISALKGDSLDVLVKQFLKYLPVGHAFYPEDQFSDQPVRAIAAEIIREKLIDLTHDELPYSSAVVIERFEEGEDLDRIFAAVLIERESQKPIIIGKGGSMLKAAGVAARQDIEKLLQKKVFLEITVKVRKGWRDDDESLRLLGFRKSSEP